MRKPRKDGWAASLAPELQDDLFRGLAAGKGPEWVREQLKGTGTRRPSDTAISQWLARERVRRRMDLAIVSAAEAAAHCPKDSEDLTRRGIAQAKFTAVMGDLTPYEVVAFEANAIAREKLELERIKVAQDNRVARRNLALDGARLLLQRVKGGEKGETLQAQIDLALEEIERLKNGEDAA